MLCVGIPFPSIIPRSQMVEEIWLIGWCGGGKSENRTNRSIDAVGGQCDIAVVGGQCDIAAVMSDAAAVPTLRHCNFPAEKIRTNAR